MSWFSRLGEQQIAKARLRGGLQGLAGESQPLPDRPGDAFVSAGDAVGFRIMAEAGVLPEELTLNKRAAGLRTHLGTLSDEMARRAVIADLANVEMRKAITEEARRKFLKG